MNKDLTTSDIHRQNILNNTIAVKQIQENLGIYGILFKGEHVFLKNQIAKLLEVDERTIDRMIHEHQQELIRNGYLIIRSTDLNDFKALVNVNDKNVVDINPKTPQLGLFNFRSFLNIVMLTKHSEQAKNIRTKILDIMMQVLTEKVGDRTYINQRDEDYLPALFSEENHRKEFTNAIKEYVEGNQWKYKHCTDAVYQAIFKERGNEYRKIINMQNGKNVRESFYAEVLTLIASFEAGIAEELKQKHESLNRQLTLKETIDFIEKFSEKALFRPLIQDVRIKIASRDFSLRDALHSKLEAYIQAMPEVDYEKFLGERSKELKERINESLDVYKRLKDR